MVHIDRRSKSFGVEDHHLGAVAGNPGFSNNFPWMDCRVNYPLSFFQKDEEVSRR